MSIVIAFISLVGVGLFFQQIKIPKFLKYFAIMLLVPVALFDQVSVGTMRNFRNHPGKYFFG